ETDLPANRACVPGVARENEAITIDVDATGGCLPCFTSTVGCRAVLGADGASLSLTMQGATCPPASGSQDCPAVCALASAKCTLPPLKAGKYEVILTGEGGRTGYPPRELVVAAAGASTCSLPQQ